jgi:hypothetical protein
VLLGAGADRQYRDDDAGSQNGFVFLGVSGRKRLLHALALTSFFCSILFWTLLVGRGQMPFEGGPLELLHSIVQKRPMPVHEVRRDIPQVLASIIDKASSCIIITGLFVDH